MSDITVVGLMFLSIAVGMHLLLSFFRTALIRFWRRTLDQMQRQLTWLFLFNNANQITLAYMLLLVCVPVFLFFADIGYVFIAMLFVALLLSPKIIFSVLRKRRARAINIALPDALLQLASAMRAGATFTLALQALTEEDAGPLGEELSLTLREHRLGARIDDALDNLAERVRSEEMDLVVSAVLIAQDVGGSLAEILQGLSETVRRKIELEGKISALTSQGILQGYVVSALPFGLLAALTYVEPEATLPMFTSLIGWFVLSVMAALQFTGAMMIKKIVTIEI